MGPKPKGNCSKSGAEDEDDSKIYEGEDIKAMIKKLITGQDSLQKKLDSVKTELESSIKELKNDLYLEIGALRAKIDSVEAKVLTLEKETSPQEGPGNSDLNIIVKNLEEPKADEPDPEGYLTKSVLEIFEELSVEVNVKTVVRSEFGSRPLKPVIVTVSNREEINQVLKAAHNLKNSTSWSKIYLERDRTRQERMLEANLRRLVRASPNLEFRKGRIIEKRTAAPTE